VYIRALTDEQLALRLRPWVPDAVADDDLLRMVPLAKERLVTLGDVVELLGFAWEPDDVVASWYAPELLSPKKGGPAEALAALEGRSRGPRRARRSRFQRRPARAALPRGGGSCRHEGR
jgi:hypothetical protein